MRDFIKKKYADENVNESTIGAQVIACSINHPSAHHYPNTQRFLFYLGNGRYRMATPHERPSPQVVISSLGRANLDYGSPEEGYFTQIKNGQVRVPQSVLAKMSLRDNDFVAFVEDNEGNVLLKKAKLKVID